MLVLVGGVGALLSGGIVCVWVHLSLINGLSRNKEDDLLLELRLTDLLPTEPLFPLIYFFPFFLFLNLNISLEYSRLFESIFDIFG